MDEEKGGYQLGRDGKRELRSSYNLGDMIVCPPMCRRSEGCPKGTPEKPKTMNEANELCYEHYRECKAVGQFPDDPVVRRNAAQIAEVLEMWERYERIELANRSLG